MWAVRGEIHFKACSFFKMNFPATCSLWQHTHSGSAAHLDVHIIKFHSLIFQSDSIRESRLCLRANFVYLSFLLHLKPQEITRTWPTQLKIFSWTRLADYVAHKLRIGIVATMKRSIQECDKVREVTTTLQRERISRLQCDCFVREVVGKCCVYSVLRFQLDLLFFQQLQSSTEEPQTGRKKIDKAQDRCFQKRLNGDYQGKVFGEVHSFIKVWSYLKICHNITPMTQ